MFRNIQIQEVLIVLLIIVLLFGASKLPALAKSIGKSARILKSEFKDSVDDTDEPVEIQDDTKAVRAASVDSVPDAQPASQ